MVESKITVVELESSKASARDDLKKPDPDEKTAAAIIEKNTVKNVRKGVAHETPKKSD